MTEYRRFLGIRLHEASQGAIHAACRPLRQVAPRLSWVNRENYHLTVRFLGHIHERRLQAIQAALPDLAAGRQPFGISLDHLGTFPEDGPAKVLWLGIGQGFSREHLGSPASFTGERGANRAPITPDCDDCGTACGAVRSADASAGGLSSPV